MSIDKSIINKVKSTHATRKLDKFLNYKHSEFTTDYHYGGKVAVSDKPEHENKIFVLEKKIKFKGRAIGDHTYAVSMYDEKGEFVKDMTPEEYDYEFIRKLNYVE